MKKIVKVILTTVLCLSANGVLFADGVLVGDYTGGDDPQCDSTNSAAKDGVLISDYAGVLVSDFLDAATSGAIGTFTVGRSGVLISDYTGEPSGCEE